MSLTLRFCRIFAVLALMHGNQASAEQTPDFATDVIPLLKARCVKCHGPLKQDGKLNLSTPTGIARGGKHGPVVQPGRIAGSLLWQRVEVGEMPPDEPLSAPEMDLLRNWIARGAEGLPDSGGANDAEHWAFRRLAPPKVPQPRDASRVLNDVDCFIQHALEKKQLTSGVEADATTLIRRVSFDLTGLPPSPDAIATFLSDSAEDAYTRMTERYLAAPGFGERWGKHWLDIAGYSDSNGYFDADSVRPLAYRYRDYVIRSMNEGKPFDQFIREQIAGDELSGFAPDGAITPRMIELLEATHFLRNAQDGTGESDGNPDEVLRDRYAVLDATVELLGSSLFGVTLQCAKCHDHKFEPITQRDYYQLQAIITPAFDIQHWLTPQARFVYAPLPEDQERFKADLQAGTVTEEERPGKIAWVTDLNDTLPDTFIRERGMYSLRGAKVEPSGLQTLSDPDNPFVVLPPASGRHSTGVRTAFANWLTRPDSRPAALLARVYVNRVWQRYFDRGLSTTSENVGYSGALPNHPGLLEWLAARFVTSGWDTRVVHRLIIGSAAYRQSSRTDPAAFAADPQNHLLWRMPLRRLDAEQFRDALLAVSGELDLHREGPAIPTVRRPGGEVVVDENSPGFRRRSVYLEQRRSQMLTMLRIFDAPAIVTNCIERSRSTAPLQSLTMLNSEFVRLRSTNMAKRIALDAGRDSEERISRAFLLALAREPDRDELLDALQFIRAQVRHYQGKHPSPQRQAWTDLCHTLLASNEFLYLE